MNAEPTGRILEPEDATDWHRIETLSAEEIHAGLEDDPDAEPTDEAFWDGARIIDPRSSQTITLRLDADVLNWLKRQDRSYEARINAILREYMDTHEPS